MQVTMQVTISYASSAYASSACAYVEWLPLSLAPVHYYSCAIDECGRALLTGSGILVSKILVLDTVCEYWRLLYS